jgi:hypothetical protein
MVFLKGSGRAVPNAKRYSWRDGTRTFLFSKSLKDTHDGLRGFELIDPDGHVLFFGRPQQV